MTDVARILHYLRPYWRLALASALLIVLGGLAGLLVPWPLAFIVDHVLGTHPLSPRLARLLGPRAHDRFTLLALAIAAGLAVTLLEHGLAVLDNYVNTKLNLRMSLDVRSDLFQHAQRLSLAFHDRRRSGMLIFAINSQADAVPGLVMSVPPIAQSVITLVGMFGILLRLDPQLAVVSLTVVPFLFFSVRYYTTHIQDRLLHVRMQEGESLSIVHEAISMLRVIVAFGREGHEYRRFRNQGEHALESRVKVTVRQTLFSLAVNMTTASGTALVLGLGAVHVLRGQLQVGELLVVMAYIASVYKPLEAITHAVGSLQEKLISLRIAFDLLDQPPEIADRPAAIALDRARGELAFEGIQFRYEGRVDTLKDISFRARAGQVIAIVGPTGAGKTTLISLIPRFYEPAAGADPARRPRHPRPDAALAPGADQPRAAGTLAVFGHDRRQHPLRAARRHDGRGHRGRPERQRARLHRAASPAVRDRARRARRQALRRRAPAALRRPGVSQGRADPHPRRADLVHRLQDRGRHPRRARSADGRPDDLHDRAPALDDPQGRPHPRHGARSVGGAGHPRGAAAAGRPLPAIARPASRRVSAALPRRRRAPGGAGRRGGDDVNVHPARKIVLLGMMSKMPVAGVIWQTLHYLIGFQRLGYDVYYVEAHGIKPWWTFFKGEGDDGWTRASAFVDGMMRRFDLAGRWAIDTVHGDARCLGMSRGALRALYREAELIINLHGGTEPLPEHSETGRLIYLETDPVEVQIELHHHKPEAIAYLEPHRRLFTFGENYGRPDCGLPVSDRFRFRPTRQPVVLDFWRSDAPTSGDRVHHHRQLAAAVSRRFSSRAKSITGASITSFSSSSTFPATPHSRSSSL